MYYTQKNDKIVEKGKTEGEIKRIMRDFAGGWKTGKRRNRSENDAKKYADPMKGRRREICGNYLRYGIIFMVWCILILTAVQVDKEYHNQSGGFFAGLVAYFVKLGHVWRIDYGFLYDALGGYSGILLAVMGMIVTGWLSLSDRLEKAVYGIRRRELFANGQIGKCLVDSFIGVFSTPAWMAYVLIRKYCFAAYFIMGLIFVQFLVSDMLLATTYNRSHDYIRLCKKIAYSLRRSDGEEGFEAFDELLDRIEGSMEEKTDWKEVNALFLSCIKDAEKRGQQELYRISRDFLTTVYAKRNRERMIGLALAYAQEINQGYRLGDDEKTQLVYWVVLDCIYQNCTEEQIACCIDKLRDVFLLGKGAGHGWMNLSIVWAEEIFAMVALQTECWLQENDSRQRSFGESFAKIIRLGAAVYRSQERSERLGGFINVRQDVLRDGDNTMKRCFKRLQESYLAEKQPQYIGSLLWSVAERYQ